MPYNAELDAKLMEEQYGEYTYDHCITEYGEEDAEEQYKCSSCGDKFGPLYMIWGWPCCSSECALKGIIYDDCGGFESWLSHVRILADLVNIYDQSHTKE